MSKKSRAGSVYLFCMGLFLLGIGGLFCWLMLRSYDNASATRDWVETPCLIIRSEVETRSQRDISAEHRWQVSYKYQFNEAHFISELYKPIDQQRGQRWGKSSEKAERLVEDYPKGTRSTCYVNPAKPSTAVLAHDTKAAGYTLWFPALFAIGGIGIMVGAVRGIRA